jgi:hypothetical protein
MLPPHIKNLIKQKQIEYYFMFSLFVLRTNWPAKLIREALINEYGRSICLSWIRTRRRELNWNTVQVGYPKGKKRNSQTADEDFKVEKSDIRDCVGLVIMEALIDKYAVKTVQKILMRLAESGEEDVPVNSMVKLKDILLIFLSGKVDRLSQFEPHMLKDVQYSPESLLDFLDELSKLKNLNQIWNECFLDFWCSLLQEKKLWNGWLYLDGHGKPYHSKKQMLCGKVSCIDKIMPITKSVMAHLDLGICVWYESTAPNTHYGEVFLKQAIQVNELLNKLDLKGIDVLCTDREGNSKKKASEYQLKNLTHLSCLKSSEYKGLEDFTLLYKEEDYYVGQWKDELKKESDPRIFAITYYIDHWVVFSVAGLKEEQDVVDICKRYSSRQEVQENAIKEKKIN